MNLLELNKAVPQLSHAPHKMYVVDLGFDELVDFTTNVKEALKKHDAFRDITDKTNINMIGVDGDKGTWGDMPSKRTHAILLDLRPLGIYVIYYWWPIEKINQKLGAA